MRTATRRIGKLEDTFRPGNGKPLLLLVVTAAKKRLALDQARCAQILGECGFLLTGLVGIVSLLAIPHDLMPGSYIECVQAIGTRRREFIP